VSLSEAYFSMEGKKMRKAMFVGLSVLLFLAFAPKGWSAGYDETMTECDPAGKSYCECLCLEKDKDGECILFAKPSGKYGCKIGEYNGVTAYSNGGWTGGGYGALKYQCVDLARRYFSKKHDIEFSPVGAAKNMFKMEEKGKEVTKGKVYDYENGDKRPPENGDMLVYHGTEWGHVRILKDVKVSWNADGTGNGTAEVFEQNMKPADNPFRTITFTVDKDGGYHFKNEGNLIVSGWVSPRSPEEKAKLMRQSLLAKCATGFKPENSSQLDPNAVLVLGDSGWHPFKRYEAFKAYLARTWRSEAEIQHLTQSQMAEESNKTAWVLDVSDFIAVGVVAKCPSGCQNYESTAVFFFGTDNRWHPLRDPETMQAFGISDSDIIYPDQMVMDYYPMGRVYTLNDGMSIALKDLPDGIGGGGEGDFTRGSPFGGGPPREQPHDPMNPGSDFPIFEVTEPLNLPREDLKAVGYAKTAFSGLPADFSQSFLRIPFNSGFKSVNADINGASGWMRT